MYGQFSLICQIVYITSVQKWLLFIGGGGDRIKIRGF